MDRTRDVGAHDRGDVAAREDGTVLTHIGGEVTLMGYMLHNRAVRLEKERKKQ